MNNKTIVLYIDSMQRGGAQRVMSNLAFFFTKYYSRVVLVNDIIPDASKMEYDLPISIERVYLDSSCRKGNKQIHRIKELRRIIKNANPEVVLSFLGSPNIRMLIASFGLKTKKVVSVRNDPSKEYGKGIKKVLSKFLFLLADGIVFQTKNAASYFFKRTRERSTIIFNPVNEKFESVVWNANSHNIVAVGRLEKQKNYSMLLNAFKNVSKVRSNINLLIAGDGSEKGELELFVHNNELSNRVFFLGQIENVEIMLNDALVYVLSSDYEGMPNSLMEAMTAGIPSVSTDCPCGGPRTLLLDENFLVRCNDIKGLSEKLLGLLDTPGALEAASAYMKERAKQFSPKIVMNRWIEYLEEVAKL